MAISRVKTGNSDPYARYRPPGFVYEPPTNSEDSATSLVSGFEKREEAAREGNIAREQEVRAIYSNILNQDYEAFRAASESEIERGRKQSIGQGTQQLISSGLYGTTTASALPIQAGRVAGEQRLKLEDMLQQRKSQAQLDMAGFIERIQQPYPDYGMLMQALAAQYSV